MRIMSIPVIAVAVGTAISVPFLMAPPKVTTPDVTPIAVEPYQPTWKCEECSPEEQYVLAELQEHTKITDRNALATIMGNIKQESNFRANVCEGGARVSYRDCLSGGYGLIQWTSIGRYDNLGKFCQKYGCDPSSLEGQTRYMINESVFQRYLPEFEGRGRTVHQYMVPAYYWLGWGIKGNREVYAYSYTKKLVLS
ncbi:high light inducible protein [Synechococcus phage S-RS29]|nr:high light inducible protein [Synechococcus phage S-RS29]